MSSQITTGQFTNTAGIPYFLPLQQQTSMFEMYNTTKITTASNGHIVKARFWAGYTANGTAIVETGSGANALTIATLAQNGFTIINAATQTNGPSIVVNSFTQASNAVWTTNTNHGFVVGDTVRVTNLPSAPQFGGLAMTVTAVGSGTTFTTLLNTTGSTTSTGTVQKIGSAYLPSKSLYYPQLRVIAAITNANPMVVTTLVAQNYQVGDVVTFDIPSAFGIPQLSAGTNGLPFQATVSAVNNAVGTQTVTFANVNSTAFGVFAGGTWLGSSSYPFGTPNMVPQGEGNLNNLIGITPAPLPYANQNILGFAKQNQGANGILIGTGDGTAAATTGGILGSSGDTWNWICYQSAQGFPQV